MLWVFWLKCLLVLCCGCAVDVPCVALWVWCWCCVVGVLIDVPCVAPSRFPGAAVQPMHVNTPAKLERVVSMLVGFRLFMHYHIKATKSYLHSRMRERVDKLLQGACTGGCLVGILTG